jgi:hypothetical protein
MSIWILFLLIENGSALPDAENFDINVYYAFLYVEYFFQILAWIMLLVIAKSAIFKTGLDTTNPQIYNQPTYTYAPNQPTYAPNQPTYAPNQPTYAPAQVPQQQQYYYQQQPVHNGTPSPVNGYPNGQMVHIK